MRIVAGKHKGRRLAAPDGRNVRPTSDRARQALFNILDHGVEGFRIAGARVVDAFAGSGALGLEALSRRAAFVTFLENSPEAARLIGDNARTFGEAGNIAIRRVDATNPGQADAPCTLAFLDPPYGKGLEEPALIALGAMGWLADGAICVVETAADETISPPPGFEEIDSRRYGAARITFMRFLDKT
ncbi:MAG: 16S rRNA (guanine(966)-N(2))-methyltransferase RsmD [Rhodospirillales bacterium]|nr:16S rRNA (guanine(966)-N(2))-methyltransferase RsmD [Rhodospirillales bacterium]MCW8862254.1 16S rRNA (guanine(966)-N(2))-methyltransferase RsmD [Rhodospirillales bacterium]MCW8953219.1 16S rRNA (guanine(966)-N(2))-methyltransferase RsmD [Rhodospirillales bacterium]MCW8970067.1 16S rRNA (guanine(966)-N(2))-methyltransferase RsmD [Rhodospirillales bacterium]MCW9001692.1 16S rRNA (guanine(966)-N(2))-methyltransferase RsmD [Rhodospirillales bacterium]